ncbi:MAG: Uma2 family endonuclease [Chloroflexi bacterium]|nr:MAG: Uma2 family endonuclease [Chloroflexota bacterium]
MSGIPTAIEAQEITGDDLYAMGEIGPCELVEGRIVPMAPAGMPHGIYEGNVYFLLRQFVDRHNLGVVAAGEVGIYTKRHPDTVRGADVVFISHERNRRRSPTGFLDIAPDLVVEIMSPHDRWSDVMEKLREYFAIGVRLVWIVDPRSRNVLAYRSLTDVREFTADDDLTGNDVLPGFRVRVAEIFRAPS